jgi:hypothetical protein
MREPDMKRVQEIMERLAAASEEPGYDMATFGQFAAEYKEAIGDRGDAVEALLSYDPRFLRPKMYCDPVTKEVSTKPPATKKQPAA